MAPGHTVGSEADSPRGWMGMLSGSPDLVGEGSKQFGTDAGLVRGRLAGSPGAFELLVQLHQRSIYRLCYRFVSNHEDACDLSQEVFLRAHRG